jgi:hypothetical protein
MSKNPHAPMAGNIPGRLLLSRACFRLFPAKQMYQNLSNKTNDPRNEMQHCKAL